MRVPISQAVLRRQEQIRRIDCPACGAGPGEPCEGERGGFHVERYGAYETPQPITDAEELTLP